MNLPSLLKYMVEVDGSDLHLTSNSAPRVRIDGSIQAVSKSVLDAATVKQMIFSCMNEEQIKEVEESHDLDFAITLQNVARFRVSVFMQKGDYAAVFRVIKAEVPSFDDLNLPSILKELCKLHRGIILVTGPTGSGKSTTLAAMIDYINTNFKKHVITIEDPIEYVHAHKLSLINQRQVGKDADTFSSALKGALRQDPDVVLIGELRDLETVSIALKTAETGHLVFGTLHTNGCVQTINRIIDVFPSDQQEQVRTQLAMGIQAVVSQTLVPKKSGGRAMAMEIMVATPPIRALIVEGRFQQIYSYMQTGQETTQMRTMNQDLFKIYQSKQAGLHELVERSPDADQFLKMLGMSKEEIKEFKNRGVLKSA